MKRIEILGVGCARCRKTEQEVRRVVQDLNWIEGEDYHLEKVDQPDDIISRGIFLTPGVVVDGKVVSAGRVPKRKQILEWLK